MPFVVVVFVTLKLTKEFVVDVVDVDVSIMGHKALKKYKNI